MTTLNSFHHRRGTEGPRHDPYGFDEISIHNSRNGDVTAHFGLACWLTIEGSGRTNFHGPDDANRLSDAFEQVTGVKPCDLVIAVERNKHRLVARHLRTCQHGNDARQVGGYPWEEMLVCGCGKVLEYSFDISAIE